MKPHHQWLSRLLLAGICLCSAGCGNRGPSKYSVSGSVSFNGEPIKDGYMIFYPTDTGKDAETAPVVAGKYRLNMLAGPKKVEITASREIVPQKIGPMGGPEMEQYLPARFNRETELTAVVEKNGKNVIDFALKSE